MRTFTLINTKLLLPAFLLVILFITAGSKTLAQGGFLNPEIDLAVSTLALQPDRKIIIGGAFNNVGGQPRSKIARLNANGTLDASFQNPNIAGEFGNNAVNALALQTDGKVVIGGLFNSVGGQMRNRLARLNSDGSLDTAFTPDVNNTITAIALQSDGKILIGGYFTLVGGQTRNRVARLNQDGLLDTSFQDPNVNVAAGSTSYPIGTLAVQPDGRILIGGYFNSVSGQQRAGVARLNSDGTLDTSFNLTIDGIVSQFGFQPNSKILICGYFRVVNSFPRTSIARINLDGSFDESFQNVNIPSGTVNAFDVQSDGKIIVGGNYSNISGQERRHVARLNANGTFDAGFQDPNANFGGNFYSISKILVQPDGKVLIGGQFDTVGSQPRKNLVRLLGDGSLDLPPAQTLTVTKTADTNDGVCNSDCSLREAIAAANANVESSQINFDAQIFGVPQTITLSSDELVIADNHRLTINGTGANLLSISGNNQSRVFRINRDAVVLIKGLTILGGNGAGDFGGGNGGGIYVSPNGSNTMLTLDDVTVRNNRALAGGGIYIFGAATVNINNSTFTENTATYNYGGGGIYLYLGSLNITNSIINNNSATFTPSGGGGISVGTSSATFALTNSVVTGNTADSAGGVSAGGTGTISGSTISNNRSNRSAGGLYSGGALSLIDSTISGNTVVDSNGSGGGIFNFGRLTTSNSVVANNSAAIGGGVFTSGGLSATGLNITNNTSVQGGAGIYNNAGGATNLPVTFTNSVVSGNRASGFGGGVYNRDTINLINTTVRNNSSSLGGGGIFNVFLNVGAAALNATNSTISGNTSNAAGGGVANQTGSVNLTNSTVSNNRARGVGGGITNNSNGNINLTSVTIAFNAAIVGTGGGVNHSGNSVNARNTIFARNISGNTSAPSDFNGALNSQGYNLIENTNGTTFGGTMTGNILGQDAQLLPLGNYSGATQTHALRKNSPAIDKGNSFGVNTDQRGSARPFDFSNITNSLSGDGSDIGAFERQIEDANGNTLFDFDGDGQADVSVFRPSDGVWYLLNSTSGFAGMQFGFSTDKIVPADFDGDGKTDVAVFREGTWYLQRSQLGFTGVAFGAADDIPVPADYDGDGRADIAVFRPSNGTWYLLQSTAGFVGVAFGQTGDKPVAADYDGDGKTDVAVFRAGTWYIQRSQLGFVGIAFGESTDKPTVGDYDGDGKADVAVFRPSNGVWYLLRSQLGFTGIQFGLGTDLPVPADYDGDGKTDVAVFRDGTWYLNRSTAGFTGVAFGTATDKPVPNAFVP
jgi:uncharacterized delta-60 repeat protein/CSLREA domain-containing protein